MHARDESRNVETFEEVGEPLGAVFFEIGRRRGIQRHVLGMEAGGVSSYRRLREQTTPGEEFVVERSWRL